MGCLFQSERRSTGILRCGYGGLGPAMPRAFRTVPFLKSARGPRLQWCLKPLTQANNRLHMKMRLLKPIPTLSFGSEGHPLIRRFPQLDWNPSIASFRAQTMYLFGQVVTRVRLSCRTLKSTRIRLSQMRGSRDVSLRNILIVGWYM